MEKKIISTDKAPGAVGPYSQAVVLEKMVYTSGQLGTELDGSFAPGGVKAQTQKALENLKTVLEASGSSMDNVVKTLVFLADINDFVAVNEVYSTFFKTNPPARSAVQVSAIPKGALVEIEAVAFI